MRSSNSTVSPDSGSPRASRSLPSRRSSRRLRSLRMNSCHTMPLTHPSASVYSPFRRSYLVYARSRSFSYMDHLKSLLAVLLLCSSPTPMVVPDRAGPPGTLRPFFLPLFTQRRRRGILRTSPFGDSRKLDFYFTEFSEVRYPQATP